MPIGLTMPFSKNSGTPGFLGYSVTEVEATYYNVKALLLTNWGERPNHYLMGCNFTEFLFAPKSEEVKYDIVQRIESQIKEWLPYVAISSIGVTFDEANKIFIEVNFFINNRTDVSSKVSVTVS